MMPATSKANPKLPGRFEDLVSLMAPRAIADKGHYVETLETADRLTSSGRLTKTRRESPFEIFAFFV